MKANIKLLLNRLTPVKLLALLLNVIGKLTGSTVYTTPPVTVAEMNDKAAELTAAIEAATNGSQAAKAARDTVVAEVQEMLRTVADYVRMVAAGDRAILALSGFELSKQREPAGTIGTPLLKLARMTGLPGQVLLRWTGVPHRRIYHVFITAQDPAGLNVEWTLVAATSKVTHVVEDLEPLKPYWFCVSAIGAEAEGVKSDPALSRAA